MNMKKLKTMVTIRETGESKFLDVLFIIDNLKKSVISVVENDKKQVEIVLNGGTKYLINLSEKDFMDVLC